MSSDWSDTMVWFGQILLYLYFYHPIYMIIGNVKGVLPQDILVAKHAFEVGDKLSNSGFSSLVTPAILSIEYIW